MSKWVVTPAISRVSRGNVQCFLVSFITHFLIWRENDDQPSNFRASDQTYPPSRRFLVDCPTMPMVTVGGSNGTAQRVSPRSLFEEVSWRDLQPPIGSDTT